MSENPDEVRKAWGRRTLLFVAFGVGVAIAAGVWLAERRAPKTIWAAVSRGDLAAVEGFLDEDPSRLRATGGPAEGTLLHEAASEGQKEAARFLIARGLDPAARDGFLETPLHQAAQGGFASVARLLLEAAPETLRAEDKLGRPPLHVAVDRTYLGFRDRDEGRREVVALLLRSGAGVEARDREGYAPLHRAAESGLADAVELLLEAGADPAVRQVEPHRQPNDPPGRSALECAAAHGNLEVVRLLLDRGAPVVYQTRQVWNQARSALHEACDPRLDRCRGKDGRLPDGFTRDLDVIDLLMARVGDPNVVAGYEHGTPLQVAAYHRNERIVRHLLETYPLVDATRDEESLARVAGHAGSGGGGRSLIEAGRRCEKLISERARLQRSGKAAGQQEANTPPDAADLEYVPPAAGLDAGGHVRGRIADDTFRPARYRIEVDLDLDGRADTSGRYPEDGWGFAYEVHLPSGEHELQLRAVEQPVEAQEPAVGEWRKIRFEVVPPPNDSPWMRRFFFRSPRSEASGPGETVEVFGSLEDLTGEGSEYRVEFDADGDGRTDQTIPHELKRDDSESRWWTARRFSATVTLPQGRDAARVRIVELRDGREAAATGWIPGIDPTFP